MINNLFLEAGLESHFDNIRKQKLDKIPAFCDEKSGFLVVNLSPVEIKKVLSGTTRGVVINTTGNGVKTKIKGTTIIVDCVSILKI